MSEADQPSPDVTPAATKQAVVIIHGIGEQRPMETLRSFVETVYQRAPKLTGEYNKLDDPDLGHVNRVWIVPDQATGTVELRRVSTPETLSHTRTDFFEFYWADIMQGTPLELVTAWIKGLLLRSPSRVPRRIPVWIAWILLWVLAVVFVIFAVSITQPESGFFARFVRAVVHFLLSVHVWLGALLAAIGVITLAVRGGANVLARMRGSKPIPRVRLVLPLILIVAAALLYFVVPLGKAGDPKLWAAVFSAAVAALIGSVIIPYVGDVARFVRANPATVAKREEVRKRGLALLRTLHEEKDYKGNYVYDRIVVVAHSLGTFVAYDLLQHLWQELGPTHHRPPPSAEVAEKLKAVDAFVKDEWCSGPTPPKLDLAAYRKAQRGVFHALVQSDQGWRISDFVTLGSPIVHSEFLIADSREHMERSFEERLLSSSPPRPDRPKDSMLYGRGPFVHFAAPFSAVCWTNIYDYHWFPLLGDIVSGPIPAAYGTGVDDQRVVITRSAWPPVLNRFVTHTLYWAWQAGYDPNHPPRHIKLLREALALEGLLPPD